MTQLSPNTLVQDQIVTTVTDFLYRYRNNEFADNQEILEEYQALINFINERISRTSYWFKSIH